MEHSEFSTKNLNGYQHSSVQAKNSHKKEWVLFEFKAGTVLYHIPATGIYQIDNSTMPDGFPECLGDDCELCEIEEEFGYSVKKQINVDIASIALNVVERCNMRCSYCFAGNGDYGFESQMSFETAVKAINFFTSQRDRLHIIFFGGEPLLNYGLIHRLVLWCQKQPDKKFSFGLTTNGLLMDEKKLDFFIEHGFSLKWSWDGPMLQEKQRRIQRTGLSGGAAADRISGKISKLSAGLSRLRSFRLRATIDRSSISEATENILNMIQSSDFRIAFARVSSSDPRYRFSEGDIQKFSEILIRITDHLLENKNYRDLLRICSLRTYAKVFSQGKFHRNFCGAGLNYLSVSTRGKFYLCHRFTEDEDECLGSLEKGLDGDKLRKLGRHRMMDKEPCRSCWMREICAGGCFHENKTGTGDIFKVDSLFCQLQHVEMSQALKVYLEIRKHAPDLLT